MQLELQEIHRNGTSLSGSGVVELGADDSVRNYLDKAVIYQSNASNLFGKGSGGQGLKVLKITNRDTGKSIYRELSTYGIKNVTKQVVALSYNSMWELGINSGSGPTELEVEKGCWFGFYWNHPIHATRITFRLGLPSLILSILSFLLSVLTLFIQNIVL